VARFGGDAPQAGADQAGVGVDPPEAGNDAGHENAKLDDGNMWPVAYALKKMTKADEATITALIKQAVS
jgi:hypothetical protein